MEADWEVEIGADAPVIDACWTGFVDLRSSPELVRTLEEVNHLPALAEALNRLNAKSSSLWTAKCDVWDVLDSDQIDPYELNANPETARHASSCYIDLLPRSDQQWMEPEMAISWCVDTCKRLGSIGLRNCRVDLIVRQAIVMEPRIDLGVTAYLTACGPTADEAVETLQNALDKFIDILGHSSTVK